MRGLSMKAALRATLPLLFLLAQVHSQALASNRKFTNRVYRELRDESKDKSLVVSPMSASICLAALSLGATDDTLNEINTALYMNDKDETRSTFGGLIDTLKAAQGVVLKVANKVYVTDDCTINSVFETDVLDVFDSEVEPRDFSQSQSVADDINQWVADQTENNILNLVQPSMFNGNTQMVLVNALFFKGEWVSQFDPALTTSTAGNFHDPSKKSRTVPMMAQNGTFAYGLIPSLKAKAVEMPFKGDEYSMVIVLPNVGSGLAKIESNLQPSTNWKTLLKNLKKTKIQLMLPKFKIETQIDLIPIFKNLGMERMFDSSLAELTELFEADCPVSGYVSDVVQKAFIDVNEAGTTAGAATAAVVSSKVAPKISFIARHPFLFLIRNKAGHILFIGTYR